jgi:hypothetical protein
MSNKSLKPGEIVRVPIRPNEYFYRRQYRFVLGINAVLTVTCAVLLYMNYDLMNRPHPLLVEPTVAQQKEQEEERLADISQEYQESVAVVKEIQPKLKKAKARMQMIDKVQTLVAISAPAPRDDRELILLAQEAGFSANKIRVQP